MSELFRQFIRLMEKITMLNELKAFCRDDSGATAIEYGLIAALVSVANGFGRLERRPDTAPIGEWGYSGVRLPGSLGVAPGDRSKGLGAEDRQRRGNSKVSFRL